MKTHHVHIPGGQCQHSSGSDCEGMVEESLSPLSPDLKFIESVWDVLEETGLLLCQYKILTKN